MSTKKEQYSCHTSVLHPWLLGVLFRRKSLEEQTDEKEFQPSMGKKWTFFPKGKWEKSPKSSHKDQYPYL
jgi:hypothetical protein